MKSGKKAKFKKDPRRVGRRIYAALTMISVMCFIVGAAAAAKDIAKVNGRTITDSDVRNALVGLNDGQRASILKDPNSRRQVLGELIDQEILLQEGEKSRLDQDAEYKQSLAAFRRQYLATKVLQKNLLPKLTDASVRKYYDSNKSRFSTEQVKVLHILLEDEKTANEVSKMARAPGADFRGLAEKYSKDPSAKNNRGDLGLIGRDAPFVAEFKDAAFGAKVKDVVGPVRTIFGHHLIMVEERKSGRTLAYDEVELRAKAELRQELIQDYVARLKSGAKISIDDKALDKL